MLNANLVDHIGSLVTVWTKDGNAAEKRLLHTADEFGVVICNYEGKQTFIPWVQIKYIDYVSEEVVTLEKEIHVSEADILSKVTTQSLTAELNKRTGFFEYIVPSEHVWILHKSDSIMQIAGPAIILIINQD